MADRVVDAASLNRPVIQGVQFIEGGLLVNYMVPSADVRKGELLVMTHQLCVLRGSGHGDYGDEIDDVEEAVQALLRDALEDWNDPRTDVGIQMAEASPNDRAGAAGTVELGEGTP